MKKFPIHEITPEQFPGLLRHINDPPKKLFVRGNIPNLYTVDPPKFLCVVGSRKHTSYGKEVCETLIAGLRGYNIIIVSGLALGIDAIAHEAALDAKLTTIAIPGSGLDDSVLYPATHKKLAGRILEAGGALYSEEDSIYRATPYSFPKRNRVMAGMCHATLVIEADLKSGTLITSKYAIDYNRDVFTVPGSIFSHRSDGPHMLLRLGATPIRNSHDIVEALGIEKIDDDSDTNTVEQKRLLLFQGLTPDERLVASALSEPLSRDALLRAIALPTSQANTIIMMLILKGVIVESGGMLRIT